jgi:hypothetical protein
VRKAVQELERGVTTIGLHHNQLEAISAQLQELETEVSRTHPEPEKVAGPLKRITEIASAAGALASLAGPIQSLVAWLGPLGQPIARILSGM